MSENATLTSTPPQSSHSSSRRKSIFRSIFSSGSNGWSHSDSSTLGEVSAYDDEDDDSSDEESVIDDRGNTDIYSSVEGPMCFKINKNLSKKQQQCSSSQLPLTDKLDILDDDDYDKYLTQPKYIRTFKRCAKSASVTRRLFLAQELNQACGNCDVIPNETASLSDAASANASAGASANNNINPKYSKNDKSTAEKTKNAIWTMKFSPDGKYLATAGRGGLIKVWKVISSPLDRLDQMHNTVSEIYENTEQDGADEQQTAKVTYASIFQDKPFRIYQGHSHDILSLDWSKNNFLLSSSIDKTVKLWNINETECLRTFKHKDFVTSVKFHPVDDRFFLSGCLDHKVRLWSILDNDAEYEFDAQNLVTAVTFTPNGKLTIAGTFNGIVYFLDTKNLELRHSFDLTQKKSNNSSSSSTNNPTTSPSASNNSRKSGFKVTGISSFVDCDDIKILVSSNDSKIRLISLKERALVEYFKGAQNNYSQIEANISDDKKYIITGSEDHWVYIWDYKRNIANSKNHENHHQLSSLLHLYDKKKRKDYTTFHAHHSIVTAALFAPSATLKLLSLSNDYIYEVNSELNQFNDGDSDNDLLKKDMIGSIIISADDCGIIRVFRQDFSKNIRNVLISERQKKKKLANSNNLSVENGSLSGSNFLGKMNCSTESLLSRGNSFRKEVAGRSRASSLRNRSRSATVSNNNHHFAGGEANASAGTAATGSNGKLVCDVCNGDKFTVSKLDDSQMALFCTDCGTQLIN